LQGIDANTITQGYVDIVPADRRLMNIEIHSMI
jgi:hypothetical protein